MMEETTHTIRQDGEKHTFPQLKDEGAVA